MMEFNLSSMPNPLDMHRIN